MGGRRGGRGGDAERTAAVLALSVRELADLVRQDAATLAELTELAAEGVTKCKFRVQARLRLQRLRDHAVLCRDNAKTLLAELAKSTNPRGSHADADA